MSIPASRLSWPGSTPEQLVFMRAVYNKCISNAEGLGRKFVSDIPGAYLSRVEGEVSIRTVAAVYCRKLMRAARTAAGWDGITFKLDLTGYRTSERQFELWRTRFPGYYTDFFNGQSELKNGDHGPKARSLMSVYVGKRTATPGYSNHQDGIAVDFIIEEQGKSYLNKTNKEKKDRTPAEKAMEWPTQWRKTWFWKWLDENAGSYGFYQNESIDEPWHWEFLTVPPSLKGPTAMV